MGTAISCGVDSLYTVMEYTNGKYPNLQLTHLFIASVNAELWNTLDADLNVWEQEHEIQFERYNVVARELNIPLVKVYCNFLEYICVRDNEDYQHLYTHNYITMASVLVLKKLWKTYYFSSTFDYTHFTLKDNQKVDTADYELLSMHVLSVSDFSCYSGGIRANRVDKTLELADYKIAQKTLHPCHGRERKNCSKPSCSKCLRALLVFDYYDKLDNMVDVFDIEAYRENRSSYLWHLVSQSKSDYGRIYFLKLYEMFCKKYPEDMSKASARWEHDNSPQVLKKEIIALKKYHNLSLDLLNLENPREYAVSFL